MPCPQPSLQVPCAPAHHVLGTLATSQTLGLTKLLPATGPLHKLFTLLITLLLSPASLSLAPAADLQALRGPLLRKPACPASHFVAHTHGCTHPSQDSPPLRGTTLGPCVAPKGRGAEAVSVHLHLPGAWHRRALSPRR